MTDPGQRLFIPGWGAAGAIYPLPAGWIALDPPPFARLRALDGYRRWLTLELDRRPGRVALAGHSLGGALAVLAAADDVSRIDRLVLVSPAGLPLRKPMLRSAADFGRQLAGGLYPPREAVAAVRRVLRAPANALRTAQAVRALDLSEEMRRLAGLGVRATVVGCTSDTLTTARACRRVASLLGAEYRELELPGGHMWMVAARREFAAQLDG